MKTLKKKTKETDLRRIISEIDHKSAFVKDVTVELHYYQERKKTLITEVNIGEQTIRRLKSNLQTEKNQSCLAKKESLDVPIFGRQRPNEDSSSSSFGSFGPRSTWSRKTY